MKTRHILIKETEKQIHERGISAVSVRSITSSVKHNVATISYYFKTKENLYITILKDNLVDLINYISTQNKKVESNSEIENIYILIEYLRLNSVSASAISQITKHIVNNDNSETINELSTYISRLLKSKLPEIESDIFPRTFMMLENLALISEILSFTLFENNVANTELSELETQELSEATYQIYKIKKNISSEIDCPT